MTKSIVSSLFLLALTIGLSGATKVYKTVNPDGSISFSDEPSEHSETIEVQDATTVPALKLPPSSTNTQQADTTTKELYRSLKILSPSNDSAFHSGSGTVNISFTSSPELRPSHIYKIFIDNQLVGEQRTTSLIVDNVFRGTHQLSVQISDASGKIIKSSSISFTMHRPSKLN